MSYNTITEAVIGAAIEVHKQLGPGLLESAYQECLARELLLRNVRFLCPSCTGGASRMRLSPRLSCKQERRR
jgi:hypothetical protein